MIRFNSSKEIESIMKIPHPPLHTHMKAQDQAASLVHSTKHLLELMNSTQQKLMITLPEN